LAVLKSRKSRYDQRLENFKYQNWLLVNAKIESRHKEKGPKPVTPETAVERQRQTAGKAALVHHLRHEIRTLAEPEAMTESAAESAWLANRRELKRRILEDDPLRFLRWDVVTGSMFVGNRSYIDSELAYLMRRPDWKSVWEDVIREDPEGDPKPYKGYRRSSGNRIHQSYHLARFEQETGLPVGRFPLIIEFGGGYGSLCRLAHKLGFRGQYLLFDLPEFVALQKYYLGSLEMPLVGPGDLAPGKPGILCTSDLEPLGSVTRQEAHRGLFVATWSLSETAPALRERILTLPAVDGAGAYLIAYQSDFGGVDNTRFFDLWRETKTGIRWTHSEIAHMPGNYYLFGTAATT